MLSGAMRPIHAAFNEPRVRRVLFKLRYLFVLGCFVFLVSEAKPAWFLLGFYVALFGELIQVWSFASLEKNSKLAVRGPYMFTRNPMYIGRYFLLTGCLLTTGHIWGVPALTVLYYFYAVNRVKREETRLQGLFGPDYDDYCRNVNRFIPSFKAFEKGSVFFFKWNPLVKNHGHWNLIAMLGCFALLYFSALK